jgi:PAS domain-containing protein
VPNLKELIRIHPVAATLIITISGGISSFATNWYVQQSETEQVVIQAQPEVLSIFQKHNTELIKRVADLESKVDFLVKEASLKDKKITGLELTVKQQFDRIKTLEAYPYYMPGPAWMKDETSRMLFINEVYSREWGVSAFRYVGKFDHDIWPKEIADNFVKNDQEVIKCGCSIRTLELIPRRALEPISEDNEAVEWIVWKWPVVKDGKIFGIAGAAFPKG